MAENERDIPIRTKSRLNKTGIFIGILLVLFAFLWIASKLGLIPSIFFNLWPQIILIIIGIFILYKSL
ncbi:MAG: hypothetical protein LBU74_07290 [Methanobacteriaceae archaeon]|jgi:hypothetical protein|nr:hypothetical protein [Candidatus Methanorudis spinitermitis]